MPIEWLPHRIMYPIKKDIRPDFIIVSLSKSSRLLYLVMFSHGSFILWNFRATLMHSHELVTTIALLFKGAVHPKLKFQFFRTFFLFWNTKEQPETCFYINMWKLICQNSFEAIQRQQPTEADYWLIKTHFSMVTCIILCNELRTLSPQSMICKLMHFDVNIT